MAAVVVVSWVKKQKKITSLQKTMMKNEKEEHVYNMYILCIILKGWTTNYQRTSAFTFFIAFILFFIEN